MSFLMTGSFTFAQQVETVPSLKQALRTKDKIWKVKDSDSTNNVYKIKHRGSKTIIKFLRREKVEKGDAVLLTDMEDYKTKDPYKSPQKSEIIFFKHGKTWSRLESGQMVAYTGPISNTDMEKRNSTLNFKEGLFIKKVSEGNYIVLDAAGNEFFGNPYK